MKLWLTRSGKFLLFLFDIVCIPVNRWAVGYNVRRNLTFTLPVFFFLPHQEVLLKRAADLVEALYGLPHNNQVCIRTSVLKNPL